MMQSHDVHRRGKQLNKLLDLENRTNPHVLKVFCSVSTMGITSKIRVINLAEGMYFVAYYLTNPECLI